MKPYDEDEYRARKILKYICTYFAVVFSYFGIRALCILNHIPILYFNKKFYSIEDFIFRWTFRLAGILLFLFVYSFIKNLSKRN